MQHLIKITNDLFDIAARLKSVKSSYVLYYNKLKRRYEVYDGENYAFAVMYDELDGRTIDYALRTAVRNADEIFKEIERNNREADDCSVRSAVAAAMRNLT